jgi:DNA repair protein RadA/Sms
MAVVDKRARMALGNSDLFVNVAGGIRVTEPAADLGLALSLAGNLRNRALPTGTVVIGELGLAGEVRRVARLDRRLQEAHRRGLTRAIVPAGQGARLEGMTVIEVGELNEAIEAAFPEASARPGSPGTGPLPVAAGRDLQGN